MDWQSLKQTDIQNFMRLHEDTDVSALALKKSPVKDWPYPLILDQIKARQKAKIKVPDWLSKETIFPPPGLVEQASSMATARYKAALVSGETFADLTAGMGIDSASIAAKFKNGTCIERDLITTDLLRHNFAALGITNLQILCADAEEFVKTMPPVDLVYVDPQRRDDRQKGKFMLDSASPDILKLLPALKDKTKTLILKTSPMLDIAQCCAQLETVCAVHIIEWRGDCKEVLYILDFQKREYDDVPITASIINDEGQALKTLTFKTAEERKAAAEFSLPLTYVFEPSPALQKAGGFKTMAKHHGLKKLHPHTHLYTSDKLCPDFPGRHFEILGIYPAQREKIPLKQASITVRNFPAKAEDLHKKLKIRTGGQDTLLACTLADECKALLHVRKI